MCDYVSSYPYESEIQYELSIDDDNLNGEIFTNPKTELTRTLQIVGGTDDRQDVYTITVASTIGFPHMNKMGKPMLVVLSLSDSSKVSELTIQEHSIH
jgi:hypothetical protein